MIFVYRVTAGQEKVVVDVLRHKVAKDKLPIYSIALLVDMRGYLILEAEDEVVARQAAMKIPHIKGVLDRSMDVSEIAPLIEMRTAKLQIAKGDVVELISGPFKGEKAKIIKIDESKDEVTVELLEVAVPIPVTIKINIVKIYRKAE
ncbi:MAG: transcription elongation factor Spt5 [Candidatus Micrarchaeota archaeon]|nr:transcription elongation factor Spt5 [Candidatus Micrarchaeota archaeon]